MKPLTPAAEGIKRLLANGKAAKAARGRLPEVPLAYMPTVSAAEMKAIKGRRNARPERIEPTPQRLAKGDLTSVSGRMLAEDDPRRDIRHQVSDPLETSKKHLTDEETRVLAQFLANAEYAFRTKQITTNYDGVGGGTYGPRDGGVPDTCRDAVTIYQQIKKDIPAEFAVVAELVARGLRGIIDGDRMTVREVVRMFTPQMHDKARLDGGWNILLKTLCWTLKHEEEKRRAKSERAEGTLQRLRIAGAR